MHISIYIYISKYLIQEDGVSTWLIQVYNVGVRV